MNGWAVRAGAGYWPGALALSSMRRDSAKRLPMREDDSPQSREDRLAAKLRENLRRRKEQARILARGEQAQLPKDESNS